MATSTTPATHASEPARGWGALFAAMADIKLAHSVFALPFALLAWVMAIDAQRIASTPMQSWASAFRNEIVSGLLIIVCMVCARTWAMLVNRAADYRIDAKNPRTARRAIASGTLSPRQGWAMACGSAFLFIVTTALFGILNDNWWPVILSGPVLGWIGAYAYMKRFSWLCHVFLGGALAISPIAAVIAVWPSGVFAMQLPSVFWISGMVLVWVAGFDVIYALADRDFDQREGIYSMPARFGVRGSLWISRAMHLLAAGCLGMAWFVEPRFGAIFGVAVGIVWALLIVEHVIVAKGGERGLDAAFFTVNGIVSCVLGVAGVVDVVG